MKFELVEYYPVSKKMPPKNKNVLGTVHIYCIDNNMDLRGIKVIKKSNKIMFFTPCSIGYDEETGKKVQYPVYAFTSQDHQKAMLNFLHDVVKPFILSAMGSQEKLK